MRSVVCWVVLGFVWWPAPEELQADPASRVIAEFEVEVDLSVPGEITIVVVPLAPCGEGLAA